MVYTDAMGKGSGKTDRPGLILGEKINASDKPQPQVVECLRQFERLGVQKLRLCFLGDGQRIYLMLDHGERTQGPIIATEDTVVEGWDWRNGSPFEIMGDSRSFQAGEAADVLRQLPDGCGDMGVQCAFAGYEEGISVGQQEGRDQEYLNLMEQGYSIND